MSKLNFHLYSRPLEEQAKNAKNLERVGQEIIRPFRQEVRCSRRNSPNVCSLRKRKSSWFFFLPRILGFPTSWLFTLCWLRINGVSITYILLCSDVGRLVFFFYFSTRSSRIRAVAGIVLGTSHYVKNDATDVSNTILFGSTRSRVFFI